MAEEKKPRKLYNDGKPRKSTPRPHLSPEKGNTAKGEELAKIIMNNYKWSKMEPVKNEEELINRLDTFFETCCNTQELPTVEKMALALGIHRQTLWQWETGQIANPNYTYVIKKAKQILHGIDAELAMNGKIPPVTYIFRSKNYYGMKDVQEHVATVERPYEKLSGDKAQALLSDSLPEDE